MLFYSILELKQILVDLSTAILVVVIGLFVFKRLNRFHKLILSQVLIYLIIDGIALKYAKISGELFNLSIPVEIGLLFLTVEPYFKAKKILTISFSLFLFVYLIELFVIKDEVVFTYRSAILEGLILTAVYLFFIYNQFRKKMDQEETTMIIASVGMIIYFAGTIPNLGIMFSIYELDQLLSQKLFQNIVLVLAHVRYSLIALAFLLQGINTNLFFPLKK